MTVGPSAAASRRDVMHAGFHSVAEVAPYCDSQVGGWPSWFGRAWGGGVGGLVLEFTLVVGSAKWEMGYG